MAIPANKLSSVYVEATLTDSLGIVTEVDSLVATNNSAPIASSRLKLPDGVNTITIPSGSRGVIISFGALCDSIKVLKGVGGDTGLIVALGIASTPANTGSMMLLFGASVAASFVIDSSAAPGNIDPDYTEFQFF